MYTDALAQQGETPACRPLDGGDHPNAVKLKAAHSAFQDGDLDKLFGLFADDMVWRVPGDNALSGTFRGREEVMRNFGMLAAAVDAYWAYPLDYFGSDAHVVLVAQVRAKRGDKVLDERECLLFKVGEDGRFTHCWHMGLEPEKWDWFFSRDGAAS